MKFDLRALRALRQRAWTAQDWDLVALCDEAEEDAGAFSRAEAVWRTRAPQAASAAPAAPAAAPAPVPGRRRMRESIKARRQRAKAAWGARVEELLEQLDCTQRELGAQLNVSHSSVALYATGRQLPSPAVRRRIEALEATLAARPGGGQ